MQDMGGSSSSFGYCSAEGCSSVVDLLELLDSKKKKLEGSYDAWLAKNVWRCWQNRNMVVHGLPGMCANGQLEWSRNYVSEFSNEALDKRIEVNYSPQVAEAVAVLWSLQLAREMRIDPVVVETDAAVVVNRINEVDSRRRPPTQAAVFFFRSPPPSPPGTIVNLYRKIWTWMLIVMKFWDCPLLHDPNAPGNFQKLKSSYEILKDEKERKLFDDLLKIKHEKQQDSKKRKMMSDLEERERAAFAPDASVKAREEEQRIAKQLKEEIERISATMLANKIRH
ncbi:hypothetical protein Q3G72_032767 [Acer saccharum]|nr:hypothetical protein Q3G72_032767 [Acer saccharum]